MCESWSYVITVFGILWNCRQRREPEFGLWKRDLDSDIASSSRETGKLESEKCSVSVSDCQNDVAADESKCVNLTASDVTNGRNATLSAASSKYQNDAVSDEPKCVNVTASDVSNGQNDAVSAASDCQKEATVDRSNHIGRFETDIPMASEQCNASVPVSGSSRTDAAAAPTHDSASSGNSTVPLPSIEWTSAVDKTHVAIDEAERKNADSSADEQEMAAPEDTGTTATGSETAQDDCESVNRSQVDTVSSKHQEEELHCGADISSPDAAEEGRVGCLLVGEEMNNVQEEEEEDLLALCECNLMEHISRVQDTVEDRLALIEKQVSGKCFGFTPHLYRLLCMIWAGEGQLLPATSSVPRLNSLSQ